MAGKPRVRVFQEFETTPSPSAPELNVVVIGANQTFLDITDANDKQEAFIGTYIDAGNDPVPFPSRDAGTEVIGKSIQVFFDDMEAEYFTASDGEVDPLFPNILVSGTGINFADFVNTDGTSFPKDTGLHNRGVKVGDTIEVSLGGTVNTANIIGIENEVIDDIVSTPLADSDNHENIGLVDPYTVPGAATPDGGNTSTAELGEAGLYQFVDEDTIYTVTVSIAGAIGTAQFTVTDSGTDIVPAGETVQTVLGVREYDIGSRGIKIVIDDSAGADTFVLADFWTISCTAIASGRGVILATGNFTGGEDIQYDIAVVDGGISGNARVSVATPNNVDNSGPHTVVEADDFAIGTNNILITFNYPSVGMRLVPGDTWRVNGYVGGHAPEVVTVAAGGDDTMTVSGSYTHGLNALLTVTTSVGGAFGTAEFTWEFDDGLVKDSGTIVTLVTDTASTVYSLANGISISMDPGGDGVFTLTRAYESQMWALHHDQPAVVTAHDVVADDVTIVDLEATAAESNYNAPGAAVPDGGNTSTVVLGSAGAYRFTGEDQDYVVTVSTAAGAFVGSVFDVTDGVSGTDITTNFGGTQTITPVAGVTEYEIGSRGVKLTLQVDGTTVLADHWDIACVDTDDISIATGYDFQNPIVYTVEVTTGGALGTAELTVTSTNNLDDDVVTTVVAVSTYAIGQRGIEITIDPGADGVFNLGNKWTINTALRTDYIGATDAVYTLEISRGGDFGTAEVRVTSTVGDTSGPILLVEDTLPERENFSLPVEVGNLGILVRLEDLSDTGFVKGDKWTITATAQRLGGLTKLVLSKDMDPVLQTTGLDYSLRLVLQDKEIPQERVDALGDAWVFDETTITIGASIKVNDPEVFDLVAGNPVLFDMPVISGAKMYVTYEGLVTGQSSTLLTFEDVDDITGVLGDIDVRNPLAYGAFKALSNTNTQVKALRVESDDEIGHRGAIDVLENLGRDQVYCLVPLTHDETIIQLYDAHIDFMSTPDLNRFRIALINQILQTEIFISQFDVDSQGNVIDFTATLIDDPDSADLNPPVFTKMIDPDGDFVQKSVTPGDVVRINFSTDADGNEIFDTYEVDRVVSDEILILLTGPTTPITTPTKYQIVRPLTVQEQAENHAAIAQAYLDRRLFLTWPDFAEDNPVVPGYFLAAALGGMIAGNPPHQGLTNKTVAGFSGVSRTTQYFTQSQLDTMGDAGVLIFTQDGPGAPVKVRHQVSTDRTSVETSELSITKNVDFISFTFIDALEPFIGVWNINDDTLEAMRNVCSGVIERLKADKLERIGAPLIDATIISIAQNEILKDNVDIFIDIEVPFPVNFINLHLLI